MRRPNIYLDDQQIRALRLLAASRGESVATIVRDAVDDYLRDHLDREALVTQLDETISRLRSRIPPTAAASEIESDITAVREEVRATRPDARGH